MAPNTAAIPAAPNRTETGSPDRTDGQREFRLGVRRHCGRAGQSRLQNLDQTVGNVLKRHGIAPAPKRSQTTTFYEKVVKVKADVAAILNFFSRSIPQIEADSFWTRPGD